MILDASIEFDTSDYDKDHWYCPFCCAKEYNKDKARMENLKHDPDCEYSIARGLMTGVIAT